MPDFSAKNCEVYRLGRAAGENYLAAGRKQCSDLLSREVDLDLSKAITDLKMLEHTHQAALGTSARILRPTLLDFLR